MEKRIIKKSAHDNYEIQREVELLVEKYYSDPGSMEISIQKKIILPGDCKKGRKSYALYLNDDENMQLPGIRSLDLPEGIRNLYRELKEELEISKGRTLLNFQIYYNNNAPVIPHFDGQYFSYTTRDRLEVEYGTRPEAVAVYTVFNKCEGAGTVLHNSDESIAEQHCGPSDIIIFDNLNSLHSVRSLHVPNTKDDEIIRMTIGLRSVDEKCHLVKYNTNIRPLTYEEAVEIHASEHMSMRDELSKNIPF